MDFDQFEDVRQLVASFTRLPEFDDLCARATGPDQVLTTPVARGLYYSLCRYLRPQLVLEIGTFHCGTTWSFARALADNGSGTILTIDPFGAEVVPPILGRWPDELRERVIFWPVASMHAYMNLEARDDRFGLIFIDGHHDYAYASYDLEMAAQVVAPGGVVILDDSNQTGVAWAARDFLAANPGWTELGTGVQEYNPGDPFATLGETVPHTSALLLQAPELPTVGARPKSFKVRPEGGVIRGLTLDVVDRGAGGWLHALCFLRGFFATEQLQSDKIGKVRVDASGTSPIVELVFDKPLEMNMDGAHRAELEILLQWQGDVAGENVTLNMTPRPLYG